MGRDESKAKIINITPSKLMKNSQFIEGVNIIAKYIPDDNKDGYDIHGEHDQLWFGSHEWVTGEEDIKKLEELGWFEDEERWSCWT